MTIIIIIIIIIIVIIISEKYLRAPTEATNASRLYRRLADGSATDNAISVMLLHVY